MRVLHLTDTHLGAELQTWGHPRGWRRAHDCLEAMRHALEPALREQVDLVVHSGDVFDRSSPPPEAIVSGYSLLREVARRVPVVVMAGNHDRHGIRRHFVDEVPGLHVLDEPTRLVFGDLALGFVPYRREAEAWSADAAALAARGVDALVAHQSFHGARVPGFTFREGHHKETVGRAGMPRDVGWILCGHIHPRHTIRLGGAWIVHPGSTVRTSFAEGRQPKGYAMWRWGREVSHELVDLPERAFVSVSSESELGRVGPGALVRVSRDVSLDLAQAVIDRGGWLAGARPPSGLRPLERQAELFAVA